MSVMRDVAKFVTPAPARQLARAAMRRAVFWRALKSFERDPAGALAPDSDVLARLIHGWGNEAWSANSDYLRACLSEALAARGPTLECGSGLTTILLGILAQHSGYPHWALEHSPEWSAKVGEELNRYGIESVHVHTAPLREYDAYAWYDPPLRLMPERFALVVCDGPPGNTRGGRYGLLPVMRPTLAPGCVILLDDATRPQERAIATRWESELGLAPAPARAGGSPSFIRIVVPETPAVYEPRIEAVRALRHATPL